MDEQLPTVSNQFDTLWDEEVVLGKKLRRAPPKTFDRDEQAKAIVEVFHAIGGVPRFAHWANEHPGYFYTKLLTKTLPSQTNVTHDGSVSIVYRPSIAPGPLDGEQPAQALEAQFTEVTEELI
jgi:hypothetical protein